MSTFNNALSSVWTTTAAVVGTIGDAADVASKFVRKHKTQQNVGHMADIEMFVSSKMLEVDEALQRNAEKRTSLNQELIDSERSRVNEVLQALKKD